MIEINNQKVQCPNCKELLFKVITERENSTVYIYWYHQYENFCLDVFDITYYEESKTNHYFTTLKELFNIEL